MRKTAVCGLALALAWSLLGGATLRGDDILKGRARWEWTLTNAKGKQERGKYMGYVDGRLMHADRPIGTWKSLSPTEVHVVFTSGPLEGTVDLRITRQAPLTCEGDLVRKGGAKERMVVVLLKD